MDLLLTLGIVVILLISVGFILKIFNGKAQPMPLNKVLSESKELGIWLHKYTNDVEFNNVLLRERIAFALFQQALDVEDGIIVLLQSNLPGPALALARPRFESYVRGLWLLNIASDDEINNFTNGKCPIITALINAVGNNSESGGAWVKANADANLKDFHDLTHGGMSHVLRRLTLSSIEPIYPENELIALVEFGIEIRIRIGVEILAKIQNEEALILLNEKAKKIRKEP